MLGEGIMTDYTTIRISVEDKRRLERLAKIMNCKSLAETLRRVLSIAEKEIDRTEGDVVKAFSTLKYAKDIGETNATKVDEYLYGE